MVVVELLYKDRISLIQLLEDGVELLKVPTDEVITGEMSPFVDHEVKSLHIYELVLLEYVRLLPHNKCHEAVGQAKILTK